jgi:hypothetical protein
VLTIILQKANNHADLFATLHRIATMHAIDPERVEEDSQRETAS